jgi:di/tricarboxylate transporter
MSKEELGGVRLQDHPTPPTLYWVSIILFLLLLFFASYLFYDYKVKQLEESVLILKIEHQKKVEY